MLDTRAKEMFKEPRDRNTVHDVTNVADATGTVAVIFMSGGSYLVSNCTKLVKVSMVRAHTPPVHANNQTKHCL